MASFQPGHPPQLVSGNYDGRTAFAPAAHIFASPISYGNLPFGPRGLPPHTVHYHGTVPPLPYAGPDPAAYRPASLSSAGSLLSPVHLVGPFLPGFPAAPPVPSDFRPSRVSDRAPQRSDFPPAGAPVAQSGAPSRRRQSQPRAVRQFQSSAPSRGSGSSVSSVALPVAAQMEEPRKRRLVVRLPPAAAQNDGTTAKRSPLSRETRETIERTAHDEYATCVALTRDALVSRDRHFDEIRSSTLPESLDVYLPGRQAWHDVHDGMQDTLRAEREPDDGEFLRHLRRHSYEDRRTDNSVWHTRAHIRSTSLFSSPNDLPPRLRSAVESLRRRAPGHGATASMHPDTQFSFGTPNLSGHAAFSTRAAPAFAPISSNEVPARSASCVSNRTDVTGIASLSASDSTAGEVDEPVDEPQRRQIRTQDEPSAARRDDFVMPCIHSDDSHDGNAESTGPDEYAQDRGAEQSAPKRRQPRESTAPFPALELAGLATIHGASRSHYSRPLVPPASRRKSGPQFGTVDGTAGLPPLSMRSSVFFADQGEPGSLSVSPASPIDAYYQPPSPKKQLSATASNFVPAFSSSHLANPAPIVVTRPATALCSSQSSTGRRPLPPLPTAAPPKLVTGSRGSRVPQLPQVDTGNRPYPALELIHPQPRRPLPATPIPMSSPSPSPSPIDELSMTSRHRPFARTAIDHEDSVNRSSLSLDDPLPEQYKPPRSIPRGRLVMPAVVPSGAQGALASDFVESDFREALLERVTETSPARMGDCRALSALDTAFRSTLGSAARRGSHPLSENETVASAEADSPPSLDMLLVDHFNRLQASVVSESAQTRAALELLTDGLKAVTTKQESFIAEIKDVVLARHSSLIDLSQALSHHIDAIPRAVSSALESDFREKVILNAVRPISNALPSVLEELHALRNLFEQRLPCTPLDNDLGTSASTLVKSVDLTEMLPVQPSSARPATDVVLAAVPQSGTESHPAKARARIFKEELALQEGGTTRRYSDRKMLRQAQDADSEREDILGKRRRFPLCADLSREGSPSPSSSGEQLFAAARVSEDADDEPTNGTASKDVFHGDVASQDVAEEHAYTCSSDGWYSRKEQQDGHAFL